MENISNQLDALVENRKLAERVKVRSLEILILCGVIVFLLIAVLPVAKHRAYKRGANDAIDSVSAWINKELSKP